MNKVGGDSGAIEGRKVPRGDRWLTVACACWLLLDIQARATAQSTDNSDSPTPTPSTITPDYPECEGYVPHIGDAVCDASNNNADCGFDGGDCCSCTCVDSLSKTCGASFEYDCVDPDVPEDCGVTPSPATALGFPECKGYMYSIQDGHCDDDLNNAECGYDGGDCCRCTCRDYSSYYNTCGFTEYDCQDPLAPTDCDTESPTPSPAAYLGIPDCTGYLYGFQDGSCDAHLNNVECGFDGGDCCRCTCIESGIYSDMHCGSLGFDCLDPSAPEDCSTDSPTPSALYPDCMYSMDSFQDAFCDVLLNSAACGYDGGDCCECTCDESNASSTSSSTSRSAPCSPYYPCYDPYSGCANSVETDDVTYDSTYTFVGYCMPGPGTAGDGRCDSEYNNAECDYDSGDCCECNCVDGDEECGSNGYDCSDPRSLCYGSMVSAYADDDFVEASSGSHEEAAYVDCTATFVPTLGDGRCDITLNNAECSYDGGDCCKCTCVDGPEYTCGVEGYTCFQITCLNDDEEDDGAIEGNDAEDNSAAAVFPNTASPDRFTDVEIFGIVVLGAFGVAVLIGAIAASCWCARRKSTEAQGPGKVMSGRARLQPGVLQGRAPARDASARERPPAYGSGARHSGLPHDGESTGRFPDGDDVETGSARRAVDDESGRVVVAASAVGTKSAYLSSPPGTATPINPAWTPRGADEEKIHEFCAESEGEPSGDSNTTLKTPSSTHMVAAEAIGTATHGASPPASSESAAPLSEPVNETEPLKAEVVERDSGSHDRTGVDTRSAEEVVDGSNNPDEVVEDALRPGDVETAVPSSSDEADGPGSVDESRDGESRDGDGDAKTFESPDD